MRKILNITSIIAGIVLATHAWAANFSDPVDGVFRGVFGDTVTVEVPSLVSKSPLTDADQNGNLSFRLAPSTAYNNFSQLTDLKNGDRVRVDYSENANKDKGMVANSITKLGDTSVVTIPSAATTSVTTTIPGQTVTTTTTSG